ncbi:MAG: amino acid ABC transporter permease [Solobacterium sp.]|nr:amino acid ABC transporter permease [Solobacterium sp.]
MSDVLTIENLLFMLKGAGWGLLLALGAILIGGMIGILCAFGKTSKHALPNLIASIYVELFRGTPMLLQILFFYLGVPVIYQRITGMRMNANPYLVGLLALSFNSGAYQSELIRAGINGVDHGQWEACETLGINKVTAMKEIILPQAFKNILPPIVSEFIMLIKDSSLISNIGALELLYAAQVLGKQYYDYLSPLLVAGLMYLIITIFTSWLAKQMERRLALRD